jgi:hypothetical protein
MEILSGLMHVLWAWNDGDQPKETRRVQPVLKLLLSIMCSQLSRGRGKVNQLSVVSLNSTKFALPDTADSIFPSGHNFIGSSDLGIMRGSGYVALVEVKVVFGNRSYLAQAVAQGFAGAAGLSNESWDLGALFNKSDGKPVGPIAPVLLWNGPLLATVRVDSMKQCTADKQPSSAKGLLYALLLKLRDDIDAVVVPKAPQKSDRNRRRESDGDDDGDGSGADSEGDGGGSDVENQKPARKTRKSMRFDSPGGKGSGGSTMSSKRLTAMNTRGVSLMPLTESNLARWDSAGFRNTYLTDVREE